MTPETRHQLETETAGPVQSPAASRLRTIDAARGFAEFWVLFYHALFYLTTGYVAGVVGGYCPAPPDPDRRPMMPLMGKQYQNDWLRPLRVGDLGVPMFFVISGFCIHYPAARAGRSFKFKLWPYVARRFRRLYPTHAVAVLGSIVLATIMFRWLDRETDFGPCIKVPWSVILAHFAMVQAQIPFTAQYTWVYNPNLWSLETEFQLYMAYILLRPLGNRFGWSRLLLCLLPVSLAFVVKGMRWANAVQGDYWFRFWCVHTCFIGHLFSWTLGAYIAECLCRAIDPRPVLVWAAIGIAVIHVGFVDLPGASLRFVSAALVTAVIIWRLASRERTEGKLFAGCRWLGWYGERSYSLYLWHAPILKTFYILVTVQAPWVRENYWYGIGLAVVGSVMSLYVARFMYWLVERHFIAMPK